MMTPILPECSGWFATFRFDGWSRGKLLLHAAADQLSIERDVIDMNPTPLPPLESVVQIVLDFNEAFNRHDVAGMMQRMSDDCVFENTYPAPDGTVYSGKEVVAQFWQDFFRDSSQAHIQIEEIFGSGMHCVMRWKYAWVEGTGKQGHIRGVDIFQVKNGLICEKLSYVKG